VRWVVPWKQLLAWFDSPDKQLNAVKDAMNYVSRAFFWLEDCFKYSEAKKTVLAVWPTRVIRLALFPNFRDLESEEKMGPHAGVNWSNMMGLRFHEGVLEMVNCKDGPFAYSQPGSMSENTWRSVPLLETLGPKIPLTLWRQTEAEPNKNQLALALTTLRDALGDAKADFATDWGAMCPHVKMNKEYIPRDFYATIERVADGFKRLCADPKAKARLLKSWQEPHIVGFTISTKEKEYDLWGSEFQQDVNDKKMTVERNGAGGIRLKDGKFEIVFHKLFLFCNKSDVGNLVAAMGDLGGLV